MNADISTISIKHITWKYLFLILIIVLAGIALSTGIAIHSIQQDEIVHESFQRNVLSKDFSELVTFYRDIASNMSNRHELIDILEFGDIDKAVSWAKNTRDLFPESIGVALINVDGEILGEPLQLRLGKQCIRDLEHKLSDKMIGQPAVHDDVPSLAHFDIIQPVKYQDQTVGLLFMSFSLNILQRRAEQLVDEGQYLLIEDNTGKKLAHVGQLSEVDDIHVDHIRIKIPETDWHIHYMARHDEGHHLFYIALAVSFVILIATAFLILLFSSRLVSFLQDDFRLIRNKLSNILADSGDVVIHKQVVLKETAGIMNDVSLIVEKIKHSNEKLKQLSTYDALTGLLNRRVFNEELVHHIALAGRGLGFRLVLLDLDRFKIVNDTYGHAVGDEVLVALSDSLRERCRTTDLLARLGGDEFALIMPGDTSMSLDDFYHDLDALFVSKQACINKGQGIDSPCHLSAGAVSVASGSQHDSKQLMEQADKLLYEAKHAGRAKIHFTT